MNKLYVKLVKTNIKNGRQFYIPYILAGMLMVILFYSMRAIYYNDGLKHMPGSRDIQTIMNLGTYVIVIFSFIFIFYTNSFIMKRRKKDIGIYNILGMEKRHIARELFAETMLIAAVVIIGGLFTGVVFNKFFMMFLYKILNFETSIKFTVSWAAVCHALVIFVILYLMTIVYNVMQVRLSNPIGLLKGSSTGEKEPRTKIFMAIMGFVCIGTGYYFALTTENPVQALMLFFVSIVLVIIGTYCLFAAGSIAILKMLKNNKNYYYKKKHFIAVSGMIYRMKQNSVGLANICILSTMVLVMVSTTVSMYIGEEDILKTRFTSEIKVSAYSDKLADRTRLKELIEKTVKDNGRNITKEYSNLELLFAGYMEDGEFKLLDKKLDYTEMALITFITKEDYASTHGIDADTLLEDEIALFGSPVYKGDEFNAFGQKLKVKKFEDFDSKSDEAAALSHTVKEYYYVVVSNESVLEKLNEAAKNSKKSTTINWNYNFSYQYNIYMDIDGTPDEKKSCEAAINNARQQYTSTLNSENKNAVFSGIMFEGRESSRESFYTLYGGFFFLGIFLGAIFLIITVIIIFYKQISEGYEDKERFLIMEKVGMSKKDIKTSIRSQIKMVFLFPIAVATIHVAAAFPMIKRLLLMLNMVNSALYGKCVIAAVLIFAVIYVIVFMLTSRTYYKIVGDENR